jgi:hypothetical protein
VGVRQEAEKWLCVLLDTETAVRGESVFHEPCCAAAIGEIGGGYL